MSKMEWLEIFELGVPEIDGDHRTMLCLMKAVRSAAGDRSRARRYLDRLFAFSRSHFAREEALLGEWGYPGVAAHARYHAELLERAARVRRACEKLEEPEALERCCEEMMSFLVDDVIRGDMNLKSFFNNAGLTLAVQ